MSDPTPTPLTGTHTTEFARCPTCGPTKSETHPRRAGVTRCTNCQEWLTITPQIVDVEPASPLFSMDMFALNLEWDRPSPDIPALPRLVGPFATRQEADDWARLNVVNGSWNVTPLAWPYMRSQTRIPPGVRAQPADTEAGP